MSKLLTIYLICLPKVLLVHYFMGTFLSLSCNYYHTSAMPQSHTTALFKTVKRRRRTAEDSLISLRFRIFNVTHVFRMTHNTGVLSPEYSIEEMGSDGVPRPVQSTLEDCYFAQEMRDEEMATVTVCGDDIVSAWNVDGTMCACRTTKLQVADTL